MQIKSVYGYLLLVLCVVIAYYLANYLLIGSSTMRLTVGGTIENIDSYWYDKQFSNFMDHGLFTIDTSYPEYRVRRTPVYPIFLGVPVYFLGAKGGLLVVMILQVLLHIISTYLIGKIVFAYTRSRKAAIFGLILYGVCPFISIYLFYTKTEALSPFFVVLLIYCFTQTQFSERRKVKLWVALSGLALGLSILHRPLLGLFALPMGIVYLRFFRQPGVGSAIRNYIFFGLGIGLALAPWIYRNYKVTGEFVPVEKWYYEDPMDFGRGHTYFRNWIGSFTNPANISPERFGYSIRHSRSTGEAKSYVERYFKNVPQWVRSINDSFRVKRSLELYASCLKEREASMAGGHVTLRQLGERPCEFELKSEFMDMSKELREANPLRFHLFLPGRTFIRDGIFNSFSFPWPLITSNKLPGWGKLMIKGSFFVLNVLLWMGLLVFAFSRLLPISYSFRIFSIVSVIVFVGFHIFYFRYFETRYFLPLYPLMIVATVLLGDRLFKTYKS